MPPAKKKQEKKDEETTAPAAPASVFPGSAIELPELDPETALGVVPRSAGPRNPGESYDDSRRG